MMAWQAVALVSCLVSFAVAGAAAQPSPDQVQKLLGEPVDLERLAVFGASRQSFKILCEAEPTLEGHTALITRLQYGSLSAEDQEAVSVMMAGQYESNESIFAALGKGAADAFCDGLDREITAYTAKFIERHPHLFKKRQVEKKEQPLLTEVIEKKLGQYTPFEVLYIIRVAENRIGEDQKKLIAEPANGYDGFLWALKVAATEYALLSFASEPHFPDVSEAYRERSNILARYIRGEATRREITDAELKNERRKNAVYQRHLDRLRTDGGEPSPARVSALDVAANEIGRMIIGHAKLIASDKPD
jgi:hypothetical protein